MTTAVHRKHRPDAPEGFFACEAAGLRWLVVPGGPRIARVLGVDAGGLDLELVVTAAPTAAAAAALGSRLARLHDAGAPAFGSPPAGWQGPCWFGPLEQPLPLPMGVRDRWGPFYADLRLAQVVDALAARRALPDEVRADLDRVRDRLRAGDWDDDDRPARLHGDLWSGNVLWTDDEAVLIDPAAHGGHRLTDLAMLHLFGLPHLVDVVAGYQEERPLPRHWRELLPLHQLYPVGVHAVLFGGAYHAQLAQLAGRQATAPALS